MKTITITKDEYKNAVAEAILDMAIGDNSTNDKKMALLEIVVSSKFASVLEAKLSGEDKDEYAYSYIPSWAVDWRQRSECNHGTFAI